MDGRLAEHFGPVAAKLLAPVEVAAAKVSKQHEFNAKRSMVHMLGDERAEFLCDYVYFGQGLDGATYVKDEGLCLTYYDSRKSRDRPAEYRMYYPADSIAMEKAWPGDWLWVCQRHDRTLMVVIAEHDSTAARRLDRLFGTEMSQARLPVDSESAPFILVDPERRQDEDLDLIDADILLALGVSPRIQNQRFLDDMISRFGGTYPLPSTKAFTKYARSVCLTAHPSEDPDRALHDWVSTTNDLYFAYERHVLQPLLDADFANREHVDVDRFFELATKYKNGRFSRAGSSFEHHIAALLDASAVRYWKPQTMSDGSKPDFLFPTPASYKDARMADLLSFLAAKTSTKERWRQVVSEATSIPTCHLITVDRGLNKEVLDAMSENSIVPVLPEPLRLSYGGDLAAQMWNVRAFLDMVKEREARAVTLGLIPTAAQTI